MIKKLKTFTVSFDIEPIDKESIVKAAGILYWDLIINPTTHVAAENIVDALAKSIMDLPTLAKTVEVKEGYKIIGIKGISEDFHEIYV